MPTSNQEYWQAKIGGNVTRDRDTDARLQDAGWVVVRVWEHADPKAAAHDLFGLVAARQKELGLVRAK